jgi:GDP-L-fucose synthase
MSVSMKPTDRVFVAGHRGLVGSALVRRLRREGFTNLILRTRKELDLSDRPAVLRFFERERPSHVFVAAAKVGGILANSTYPADFISENLAIALSMIEASHQTGVRKLLYFGSSCVYPKHAPQPMREEHLLTGPLEPTNEWYAVAKIAGIKLCQAYRRQFGADFISAMPTNLYGPGDNFELQSSHVLPALIRKVHEAHLSGEAQVEVWGTGAPRREFLHVDDLADAAVHVMREYSGDAPINIGAGEDIRIADLAQLVAEVVGYRGEIVYDTSKPDGTPRKLLDLEKLSSLGWRPRISLREGIEDTYRWYVEQASVNSPVLQS